MVVMGEEKRGQDRTGQERRGDERRGEESGEERRVGRRGGGDGMELCVVYM